MDQQADIAIGATNQKSNTACALYLHPHSQDVHASATLPCRDDSINPQLCIFYQGKLL